MAEVNNDELYVQDCDDLDIADSVLCVLEGESVTERHALVAIAHIQLWYAKECRAYRDAAQAQRRMFQQAQQAAPPPPPPMPTWPLPNGF